LIGAFDIIRLAVDTLQPQSGFHPTVLASRDLPNEMFYDKPDTPRAPEIDLAQTIKNACSGYYDIDEDDVDETGAHPSSTAINQSTLVYRPKPSAVTTGFDTDSSSEDEGFSLVHHPRPLAGSTTGDIMSSPEIVPSRPMDVLAATGSNYPDDDDWTML
jgi:hypothetical protein